MESLTEKQLKFVELYLAQPVESRNPTQAYLDAGYTCSRAAARTSAARLLQNETVRKLVADASPPIEQVVEQVIERVCESQALTAEWIVEQLRKIASFDPRKLVHPDGRPKALHELDDDTALALSGCDIEERTEKDGTEFVKVRVRKVKSWEKRMALLDLGKLKRFGLWGDQSKDTGTGQSGTGDTNVNINVTNITVAVTQRIEQLADAFVNAAHREEAGSLPGHGSRESVGS